MPLSAAVAALLCWLPFPDFGCNAANLARLRDYLAANPLPASNPPPGSGRKAAAAARRGASPRLLGEAWACRGSMEWAVASGPLRFIGTHHRRPIYLPGGVPARRLDGSASPKP